MPTARAKKARSHLNSGREAVNREKCVERGVLAAVMSLADRVAGESRRHAQRLGLPGLCSV